MKESLRHKLLVIRNKEFERQERIAKQAILLATKVQQNFQTRREGEPKLNLHYVDSSRLVYKYQAKSYDSKSFWLTAERFVDALNWPLHRTEDKHYDYSRDLILTINEVTIRFQYCFTKACTPIRVTKSEIVGYSCS